MVTLDWTWRSANSLLPERVLLVATRTAYDDKAWMTFKDLLVPGYYRLLGDPNVIGIAVRTDERSQVSWGLSAFSSYNALESLVRQQVDWLSELAAKIETGKQIRHNAYRIVDASDLPPAWSWCESMIRNVAKASPLGADAFPELSRALGINDGDPRA